MDYDSILIEQSIAKQYHVLPSAEDELHYTDWAKMVSGLMDDTPLGRIVGIRRETDRDVLKHYTKEQRQVRSDWAAFRASKIVKTDDVKRMAQLEQMIAGMFGGG